MCELSDVRLTRHAKERWSERFPGADVWASLARARFVPFMKLLAWSKARKHQTNVRVGHQHYHDPALNVLFVVARRGDPDGSRDVVTVMSVSPPAKTRRCRDDSAKRVSRVDGRHGHLLQTLVAVDSDAADEL